MLGVKATGPEQSAPLTAQDRFPCIVGGERAGKSWVSEKILLPHVLALPYLRFDRFFHPDGRNKLDPKKDKLRNPDFTLFGPTYSQPRIEFQYLEDDLAKLGKLSEDQSSKPSDGPWRMVTTDGVVITTFSLENPESVRAIDLEGGMICEAGLCPYSGIERIRGRVAAKKGFLIFNGTIERSQRWWTDWLVEGKRPNNKGIVSYSIPSWANRHEFPGGETDPEIISWRDFLGEDLFLERCAAIARPPRERVLREATESHIQIVEIPEGATYELAVDPGYATAYANLFVANWLENGEYRFHVYDELYEQTKTTKDVVALCRTKPSWPLIRTGAIDIASKGHRDANDSALEIWQQLTDIHFDKKYWAEDRQIERLQTSFRSGQLTIDPKCVGLIAECGLGEPVFPEMHPWVYVTDRDGRVISEKPKDAWNHSAKALAYLLLARLGQVEFKRKATTWNRMKKPGKKAPPWGDYPN